LICEVDFFRQGVAAVAMQRFLSLSEPPSAVFAASDHFAVEALLFAVDSGLSVPEDVAIIGFDNTPTATRVRPKLTSIHKDASVLGANAVQLLIERINAEGSLPSRQRIIRHNLICRESA
jgi:DNA-binding LacI/PurR family transcriptional regulator